jgi:hypothetical protein
MVVVLSVLLIFKYGSSIVSDRGKKENLGLRENIHMPFEICIFRNGQRVCDDDRRISVSMTFLHRFCVSG